ncbi:TPA: hypothetical protein ACIZRI_001149 [Streptococcus agalactiae]
MINAEKLATYILKTGFFVLGYLIGKLILKEISPSPAHGANASNLLSEEVALRLPSSHEKRRLFMNYSDYIKTYEDLARQVGGMVLANDITIRNLDLINGDFGAGDEIFQFYIISDPDFLLEHTDELVFYDDELHIYVWGITHFGTAWSGVPAPEFH